MTPRELGFSMPAEWAPHEATLVAWPCAVDLWQDALPEAQHGFVALCEGITDWDAETFVARGDALVVLVRDPAAEAAAREALGHLGATFVTVPYGDIWLRDIAPIFLSRADGARLAATFRFNGWGGKYVLEHDNRVAEGIARELGFSPLVAPFVLEGGSIEVDGLGTVLTTQQCLLNPNRNPGRSAAQVEQDLAEWLGISRVLWLDEGLQNDHTDGHIDTLARFVRPGVVACMKPTGADDPNRQVLDRIARDLEAMRDARDRRLEVVRIPSPGRVLDDQGSVMPASYANFYVANRTVIVPNYGTDADADAVKAIAELFPDRRTLGAPAKAILGGGGAFHCITQQIPAK